MKYIKFLSISLMTSFAMFVSAAINQATITISGEYADDCELSIVEDNTEAANYTSKSIAPFNASSGTVLTPKFYAEYGTKQMSFAVNNSIQNLSVKFTANAYEDEYVMTFSDVQGQMTLANADTSFVIDATKPFAFTCAVSTTMEFTINPVADVYKRTVEAGQWGTICYPKQITEVTGGTLFNLTYADDSKVYADTAKTFVAGMAYVFHADAAATELVMAYTGDSADIQDANGLEGTYVDTTVPEGAYGIMGNYVVEVAAGNALLANRAYIDMSELTSPTAPRRGRAIFMIQNTPTGMQLIEAPAMKEGKMIIDGRMVIVKDGKMFNAQGAAL